MHHSRSVWASIKADLMRARLLLPDDASSDESVRWYQEYIEHNELELACEALEAFASIHTVSSEFWVALENAAGKMQLPELVSRYKQRGTV